jgi:hypothetical protein
MLIRAYTVVQYLVHFVYDVYSVGVNADRMSSAISGSTVHET